MTDVSTKRRIRNYIDAAHRDELGMNIIIQQSTNINCHIAEARRAAGVEDCAKTSDEKQRVRQAKLGCAPAHKLFELVDVRKKESVQVPCSFRDYDARIHFEKLPIGVQIGFQSGAFSPMVWDALPENEDWFCRG